MKNCEGDYLKSEINSGHILFPVCPFASSKPHRADLEIKSVADEDHRVNGPPDEPHFSCFSYHYYLSYFWANDKATRIALGIKEFGDIRSKYMAECGEKEGADTWIRSFNFSVIDDWRAWHLDGQAAGRPLRPHKSSLVAARVHSTSLPGRFHPAVAGLHDAANALVGWTEQPAEANSTAWIGDGVARLGRVLAGLTDLLHHPQAAAQDPLLRRPRQQQQHGDKAAPWAERLLDDLLLLADAHA
ncbi:hypothetical protein EJB05_04732, partial [Eragrostis curvula]